MQAKPNSTRAWILIACSEFGFLHSGGFEMKIFKSINNNIVSAFDDEGREVVVIGKGIGYKAREGAVIPPEHITKIFVMSSQDNTNRLKELLEALPIAYIELTDEILTYAKEHLQRRLNESAYFTLADHISFSVTRLRQGMDFQNVLLSEIRRFYSREFEVGQYALALIEQRLGIVMPEDEAASIALHIFNAEYDISVSDAFHATQLLNHILDMVAEETGPAVDESDYYCERFITHLKFLTQRIVKNEALPETDDDFHEFIRRRYPAELACGERVAAYVAEQFDYRMPPEHTASLAIHIRRVRTANQVKSRDE
jgi:beta-glucoside operon transcriptional antiterminator